MPLEWSSDNFSVLPTYLSFGHNSFEMMLRSALEKSLPLKKISHFRLADYNNMGVVFRSIKKDYMFSKFNCLDDKV